MVRCPENPSTGSDGVLDKNDCGCEAELIVAPECREAFFCYDRFQPEGGLGRVCPEGEVIEIEIRELIRSLKKVYKINDFDLFIDEKDQRSLLKRSN